LIRVAELRATFHFRVHGLLIDIALLGTSYDIVSTPDRVVVTFPSTVESKTTPRDQELISRSFTAEQPAPRVIGGFVTGDVSVGPSEGLARVELLRVQVFRSTEVSASGFEDEQRMDWTPVEHSASEVLWEALPIAQSALGQFLDWVRVRGDQHWLGLLGIEPEPVGVAELDDVDAFALLPVTVSTTPIVFRRVEESQVLSMESLREFAHAAREGPPSLASSLLADAAYYGWDAEPPDSNRAILIAAIACEVRVKDALRSGVDGVSAGLVDLLLDNPRDWSLAAAALWHKPLGIVYGRSLSDDDSGLFKEVERLFTRRNRIAHHGDMFDEAAAKESVRAASKAFAWLRGVTDDATP
jgi:hypothetical protein